MPKALSIIHADSRLWLCRLAWGMTLAAALLLAPGVDAASASARGSEGTPVPPRAAGEVRLVGWDHRGRQLHLHRVVPRAYPPRVHRHGGQRHGFHQRQRLQGHRHNKPRHEQFEQRGRRHYGLACWPARVVGWHRGHRALFGQVICVNRFGQRSTLRGSRYLIRYLRH